MTTKDNPLDPGFVVARSSMNQLQLGDVGAIGESLDGRMMLEVSVQSAPVPADVLRYAAEHRVTIVDPAGTIYRLPKGTP